MKRVVLVLMILLPLVVVAQEKDPNFAKNQPSAAGSRPNGASPSSRHDVVSVDPGAAVLSSAQNPTARPQRTKPAQSPKVEEPRPTIPGSMVGYIDNAIVGSQIRLRFDAGFNNNRPDRAEFFYAQCGCDGPPARGPGPDLVSLLNFQQLYMRAEYAPVHRFSLFAEVPIRWVQPQQSVLQTIPPSGRFGNQAGISDVQAGFKFALLASDDRYLTFQLQADFPSGDSSKGLGTNHYSVQPSLLFFQRVTERISFEAQLGDWHPAEGASPNFPGDVFTYGLGPSYELYRGDRVRFAPVIELVGWRVLDGLETNGDLFLKFSPNPPIVTADGTNIVNLKLGARTSIGDHNSFYLGYGQALTHEVWYKHIVRLEYRYTF
jgi:hypothetical protein